MNPMLSMTKHFFHRRLFLLIWALTLPAISVCGPTEVFGAVGVAEINFPGDYIRVVAVSDVHGMYKPLLNLLRNGKLIDRSNNWTGGKTLLIVTGDSMNKGPDSVETLNLWINLAWQAPQSGGRVIHLLGNHEAEFLADPKGSAKAEDLRSELKAKGIRLRDYSQPGYPQSDFLRSMPVAARVGKWLFCHSGLLPDNTWAHFTAKSAEVIQAGDYGGKFLAGGNSILQDETWWKDGAGRADLEVRLSSNGLFGVVFGHQNKALGAEGRNGISSDYRLIKIDNGMSPDGGYSPGSLLIFPRPAELQRAARPSVQTMTSGGAQKPLTP